MQADKALGGVLPPAIEERPPAGAMALCVDAAGGALSANTVRAMRSDLAVYADWCAKNRRRELPAAPETVAAFVAAMAEVRAPATVRRYVASIAFAHRAAGHPNVTQEAPVALALQRMYRRHGRRQGQARGLTWPLRQRLIEAADDRLIDDRNRALIAMAYDGMLRRAELTALQVVDFVEEVSGDGTLFVRRGKTDQEGVGAAVYLAGDTVTLLRTWLARSGVDAGHLFRSVAKGGRVGRALPPGQVSRIVKAMARRAGLPAEVVAELSGHSARIGAVQDMIASGIELAGILQAGRWKSTAMVNRYGERLLARRSGAAQLARVQERGRPERSPGSRDN